MNSLRTRALAVTLIVAGGANAAEPTAGPQAPQTQSWAARLLRQSDAKPPEPTEKPAAPLRPSIITAPLAAEVLAEAVKAEEAACTRRLDVCAKLREAAIEANDESLLRQIDEIERQAIEVCQARIARMGLRGNRPSVARASLRETTAGGAK